MDLLQAFCCYLVRMKIRTLLTTKFPIGAKAICRFKRDGAVYRRHVSIELSICVIFSCQRKNERERETLVAEAVLFCEATQPFPLRAPNTRNSWRSG